ncbi:hypothetical protein [Paenibacillus sp. Mc5Re-14]|uniref:hypothetical protein n=1 Tax=Paenibacillus sp. Mc5Re-14 TaxID=1030529 RepID=UPI000B04B982|nr:hypothetical protein [Paenibacillus sp. Mc5Re-14]
MSIFTGLQRSQFQAYYDEEFLIEHRFENGRGFPPSYIDYVKTLGYGRLCGVWNIHIPLGDHPDSWLHRYHDWRAWFDDVLESEEVLQEAALEPDGFPQLLEHAVPFASSEEDDLLVWDIQSPDKRGEFPIYALNLRTWGNFRYAAPDLYSFVEALLDRERVKSILGTHRTPFPYTFEPF